MESVLSVATFVHRDLKDDRGVLDWVAHLHACPELQVLPFAAHERADLVVVLTEAVDDEVLDQLAAIAEDAGDPEQRIVLVTGPVRHRQLARAFAAGVVSILPRRQTTPDLLVRTILTSADGRSVLPEQVTRWLVDETRANGQQLLAAHGLEPGGLTRREVMVLGMLADGQDTTTIAARLNYSERTIKKILQDVMVRLDLRNRTHAVSYALRVGAI